jgi:Zn-dependent protease
MIQSFGLTYIVVSIVSILISLVLHEFMHAYAGYLLGDYTAKAEGRLSLNPIDHVDPFMTIVLPIVTLILFHAPILAAKPVPFNPARVKYDEYGAAIIAAAGPLTNLVLAFLAAITVSGLPADSFLASALSIFGVLNIALFVFNLIPIPPLDGSRILYAFAPEPLQELMEQIEPYGFFIIFGLVLTGVLSGLIIGLNDFMLHLPVLRALQFSLF